MVMRVLSGWRRNLPATCNRPLGRRWNFHSPRATEDLRRVFVHFLAFREVLAALLGNCYYFWNGKISFVAYGNLWYCCFRNVNGPDVFTYFHLQFSFGASSIKCPQRNDETFKSFSQREILEGINGVPRASRSSSLTVNSTQLFANFSTSWRNTFYFITSGAAAAAARRRRNLVPLLAAFILSLYNPGVLVWLWNFVISLQRTSNDIVVSWSLHSYHFILFVPQCSSCFLMSPLNVHTVAITMAREIITITGYQKIHWTIVAHRWPLNIHPGNASRSG